LFVNMQGYLTKFWFYDVWNGGVLPAFELIYKLIPYFSNPVTII
jgi:hypothetical protein